MTPQINSALPDDFRNELARLVRAGFPLVPLGGGPDGKAPLCGSWTGPRLTLSRILAPLYRSGSQAYGVRLDALAVIDCDEDSPELVSAMEARFGPSPVHVKTPRGRHLYYRANGTVPNLRVEGLPVDIKTGPRSYVAGPLSVRSGGGVYLPLKGTLGVDALSPLRAPSDPPSAAAAGTASVPVGERHIKLVREAVQMVEYVETAAELLANLHAIRDDQYADPQSLPDAEVKGIADWAWNCRLKNSIFKGRDSEFRVDRRALDALRSCDNGTDATDLYILLLDMHGHSPGKRFPLDFEAMRRAGLTRLSVRRLRAARESLRAVGLLKLVGKHRARSRKQTFTLMKLRSSAENVTQMHGPTYERDRGEGL